jgi:hypothetical protein
MKQAPPVARRGPFTLRMWRARRDSNPRPSDPKSDALSTELRARVSRSERASRCGRSPGVPRSGVIRNRLSIEPENAGTRTKAACSVPSIASSPLRAPLSHHRPATARTATRAPLRAVILASCPRASRSSRPAFAGAAGGPDAGPRQAVGDLLVMNTVATVANPSRMTITASRDGRRAFAAVA